MDHLDAGLLVALPPFADARPLLSVQATALRVLTPAAQTYLLLELPQNACAAAAAACGARARIHPVWVRRTPLERATPDTLLVWDPALGVLRVCLTHRGESLASLESGP